MIPRPLAPEINHYNPHAVQGVIQHHREKEDFHGTKQRVFIDRHHMIVGRRAQDNQRGIQDVDQ